MGNVLKANKAFKSDSLRLLVSLRSQYSKRASHLNAALTDPLIISPALHCVSTFDIRTFPTGIEIR
ncbi:hypothetical protein DS893_14580 [Vibrionales bacterium C3R12]|nr:hypothetical protein DS893_14580 [Vibrionales bacterium C3R12]